MNAEHVEDMYPLSPMQQGMLFHCLYDLKSPVYFEQSVFRLRGRLQPAAMQRAWHEVMQANPILRTAFVWDGLDEPAQVVFRSLVLPWHVADWRSLPAAEQDSQFENWLAAERSRGFDLAVAPLMRLAIIQTGEDDYYLVWSWHHLLLDGWSTALVRGEVFSLYDSLCRGNEAKAQARPPYRDFIAWLQQQDSTAAEVFWRQQLKGFAAPTPLGLWADEANHLHADVPYGHSHIQFSRTATETLQAFTRKHHITLSTLAQGAWAVLLNRYSDEEEIVFGATISGRQAGVADIESMIGLFINSLPVRTQVPREQALVPWLQQLQAQQLEMRGYEHTSLAQVQAWSEVPPGRALFDSLLVFANHPKGAAGQNRFGDLEVVLERTFEMTNYPLTVGFRPGTELVVDCSYQRSRFEPAAIQRLLGHLRVLLESMAANPTQRVVELTLLTEAERRQLLVQWNQERQLPDAPPSLLASFDAQVERNPTAMAVIHEDKRITFQDLNRRANRLAHHLRRSNVGTEIIVGLCLERSVSMLVGLLGILKAGAAYVPLDPELPAERLDWMLTDTQAPLIVTQTKWADKFNAAKVATICLDQANEDRAAASQGDPTWQIRPDHLAYVIYTSGSTGKPKGVVVEHGAIASHCLAMQRHYQLSESDRVLQFANFSFDTAIEQIFSTLGAGAALVLRPKEVWSAQEFLRHVEEEGITVADIPPLYLHQLLQAWTSGPAKAAPPSLRMLIVGGEAMLPESLKLWQQLGWTAVRLLNAYGPTEATVTATVFEVPSCCADQPTAPVPIGRPVSNKTAYVLDRGGNPVPVGVAGELYLGGSGLARGYLNQPRLTAEKFVTNSFDGTSLGRLYKTGDRVRYRLDGSLEFLGRLDHQVKIRGFRVELAEIEAVLREHSDVAQAVVTARETADGEKRLAGYVVLKKRITPRTSAPIVSDDADSPLNRGALREYLQRRLPDYMVPVSFTLLTELPLTTSGKVDRRALPVPDARSVAIAIDYTAPRTPVEQTVAQIWAEVLSLSRVGLTDNFFKLGGHSLTAVRVISRIRDVCQVDLPLRSLFESSTLAELATAITQQQAEETDACELARMLAAVEGLSDAEASTRFTQASSDRLN